MVDDHSGIPSGTWRRRDHGDSRCTDAPRGGETTVTRWDVKNSASKAGLPISSEEDHRTKSDVAPSGAGTAQETAGRLRASQNFDFDQLTDRERQVLALLADGPSNRVIARRLGIAERTAKAHLTNLMRKLNIQTRLEAALISNLHREGSRFFEECP
ncbi:helix-turn-helix domain-containing protein [Streptomyces cathayae]|uniref:Helix-turn-helix transcriptional regulator n=1 Tax=Streptomyces cathayae TaxID=3031124 RepID=A0ABY8K0F9_9ACTN|nr:helix-turn-helix transcriptional regulator [Streptomyces sp. HUAS 5]WGD41732.1 helix-turn-helix transcriptional regulator [Streptomyces sp. HUAS 5]